MIAQNTVSSDVVVIAAPGMMELMAKPVENGFNLCAYGLKDYSEALYAAR